MKINRKHVSEIPKRFTKYGREHVLIKNEGMTSIHASKSPSGETFHEITLARKDKNGCIIMPGSSKWGIDGFTTLTIERAEMRFEQLRQKEVARENWRASNE